MKFYPLKVDAIIDETPSARSFVFFPHENYEDKFIYQAGQFLTFRIPWKTTFIERSYSLSSSPYFGRGLKVTVKRVKDGIGSNWFNDTLAPGDVIEASQPSGRFICRDTCSPLRFFAGGSGITPVISIIRETLMCTQQNISMLFANTNPDSVIFFDELQEFRARFPDRFECVYHYDSDHGYVDEETLKDFARGTNNQLHYICGPGPFMELVESVLERLGVDDRRVRVERFISPDDPSELVTDASTATSDTSMAIATTFHARLDGEEHEVECAANQTLLEAMLEKDLAPLHQCKDGHCGSCMVICNSGSVRMSKTTALSKRDKEKGYVLLCQARPLTCDVSVDCDC